MDRDAGRCVFQTTSIVDSVLERPHVVDSAIKRPQAAFAELSIAQPKRESHLGPTQHSSAARANGPRRSKAYPRSTVDPKGGCEGDSPSAPGEGLPPQTPEANDSPFREARRMLHLTLHPEQRDLYASSFPSQSWMIQSLMHRKRALSELAARTRRRRPSMSVDWHYHEGLRLLPRVLTIPRR
ncbi:hypothetical protein BD413DRAFT_113573 [Trametes elegans]|nr:hypothetical protein BD413DRAFT_113573 [Trametes elegans]